MVDLDVGVPHGHELDLHLANDALNDERPEVAEQYVILILRHAVVHLDREVLDVRSCPDGNVHLEQPMEHPVKGGADEVATCVTIDEQDCWRVDSRRKTWTHPS